MPESQVHVLSDRETWIVRREGARRASARAETQGQAIAKARQVAKREGGEVVIHAHDGEILERAKYVKGEPQPNQQRTFTAVIHKEGRWYVAECPEVGTVSQGRTVELAVANLQEATELYIEEFATPDVGRAVVTTFEVSHA